MSLAEGYNSFAFKGLDSPSRLQYRLCYYEPSADCVKHVRTKRHQLFMTEVAHLRKVKQKENSKLGPSEVDRLSAWDEDAWDETTLPESEGFYLTIEPNARLCQSIKQAVTQVEEN